MADPNNPLKSGPVTSGTISQGMLASLGKITRKVSQNFGDLDTLLKKVTGNYSKEIEKQEQLIELLELQRQQTKINSNEYKKLSKEMHDVNEAMLKMKKASQGLWEKWTGRETEKYKGGGDAAIGTAQKMTKAVAGSIAKVSTEIFSLGVVFDGVFNQDYKFGLSMKQIAYQMEGISGNTTGLQDQWMKLDKTVAYTGQSLTKFQESYHAALQQSANDQKGIFKATKAGLGVATQIGSNAEQTAETFNTWHRELQMTSATTDTLGLSMRGIAATTGVTGDHLMKAAATAKAFMETMKNTGQLTAEAAKNLITMSAMAEKLGVSKGIGEMQQMMTGGIMDFTKGDPMKQAMMAKAAGAAGPGVMNAMLGGRLAKDTQLLSKFADSLDKTYASTLGLPGKITDVAFSQKEQWEQDLLNRKAQAMGWKGFIEMQNEAITLKDSSMSLADKLSKLNKEMSKGTMTTEKRLNMENKISNTRLEGYNTLMESIRNASDDAERTGGNKTAAMSKSLSSDSNKNTLSALGLGASASPAEALSKATDELESFAKRNKLSSSVMKDLKEIRGMSDPAAIAEALQSAQQKAQQEMQANTDPVLKAQRMLMETNESLRDWTSRLTFAIIGLMGPLGIIAASMLAQGGIGAIGSMLKSFVAKPLGNLLMKKGGSIGQTIGGFLGGTTKSSGVLAPVSLAGGSTAGLKTATAIGGEAASGGGLFSKLLGGPTASKVTSTVANAFKGGKGIMGGLLGSGATKVMGGALGAIGKGALKFLPGVGAVISAGMAISDLAEGNIGGAIKHAAAGLANFVPVVGPILSMGIEFFGDTLIDGAKNLGAKAWEGTKWVGEKLWQGATWVGEKLADGAKWYAEKLSEGAAWVGDKISKGASALGDWSIKMANAVFGGGVSSLAENESSVLQDIAESVNYILDAIDLSKGEMTLASSPEQKLLQDKIEEQPDVVEATSEDLSEIADNTALLKDILEELKQLNKEKPSTSLKIPPSSTQRRPTGPKNYYELSGGSFSQGASRQVK